MNHYNSTLSTESIASINSKPNATISKQTHEKYLSKSTKHVAHYKLGVTLGKGKWSKVKYAIDTRTNKAYAIKIMSIQNLKKEKMELQLRKEVAIMKMVKHPNIVQLKKVLQTNRNIYIVMELVRGGELFDKIVLEEKFSEQLARKYFQQLIISLEYCHKQGIAHRDLKPENLLLDESDNLKITDFGLSTLTKTEGELLKTTCGTPQYVAPEIIQGKGYDGFKADIWSCGIILYVMICGYLPFEDKDRDKLFKKINSGKIKYPKFISKEVKELLIAMLNINYKKRININQMKHFKWFKVGFFEHLKKMESYKNKFIKSISKQDIYEAITQSHYYETNNDNEVKNEKRVLNAFDIASFFMMRGISHLVSGKDPTLIKKRTKFMFKGDPQKLTSKLIVWLKSSGFNPKINRDQSKIKCYAQGPESKTVITFTIEMIETIGKMCLVICQRGKGNFFEFRKVYKNLITFLGTDVVSKPINGGRSSLHISTSIKLMEGSIDENASIFSENNQNDILDIGDENGLIFGNNIYDDDDDDDDYDEDEDEEDDDEGGDDKEGGEKEDEGSGIGEDESRSTDQDLYRVSDDSENFLFNESITSDFVEQVDEDINMTLKMLNEVNDNNNSQN